MLAIKESTSTDRAGAVERNADYGRCRSLFLLVAFLCVCIAVALINRWTDTRVEKKLSRPITYGSFKASQLAAVFVQPRAQRPAYTQMVAEFADLRDVPGYFDPITERTLVLYVFANNDPVYIENLRFFVEAGVRANDPADYVFLIQQDQDELKRTPLKSLPPLPPNARYVEHANECLDWGTSAWFLELPKEDARAIADLSIYKYFILMNSSVRGPFVPAWVENLYPFSSNLFSWTNIFTNQVRKYAPTGLKYVGVSLSCTKGYESVEHVQSYLVATDAEGMRTLKEKSTALKCHRDFGIAVIEGEVGASQGMLNAGYNIGVIPSYGELLDYRNQDHCYRHGDILVGGVDGIKLDPFDLVFTKYRTSPRPYDSTFAFERAQVYDRWWRERKRRREQWEFNQTFSLD